MCTEQGGGVKVGRRASVQFWRRGALTPCRFLMAGSEQGSPVAPKGGEVSTVLFFNRNLEMITPQSNCVGDG